VKRVHGWAPAALVAALVAVGAFLPGSAVSFHLFRGADKLVHLVEFALLGAVTYRAVWYTLAAWPVWRQIALTCITIASFAVLTEVGQLYVPHRSAELADLLADLVGLAAGMTLWYAWAQARRRTTAEDP